MSIDWDLYRKCPACQAALGTPCTNLTGRVVNGRAVDVAYVQAERPHTTRRLRTGAR